jgi:hypothetical protein
MNNYSFSDLITFTRTTNATLVDGTGNVTYAPNNLFTNSEAFDASSWTKANATVGANATSAPNSTTTADAIIENTATSTHGVNAAVSVTIGVSYVLSVYAKQNGRSLLRVGSADSQKYGVFDLIAGVVQYVDAGVSASITSLGDGWYRCAVTERSTVTGTGTYLFRMQSNTSEWPGTGQYTGNGVSGVFLWGAQLEAVTYQTTAGTYNSTSPPNLLGFTQEFENAGWTKAGATISQNITVSPDDTLNADKLVEDSSTGQHRVQQAVTTVSGTSYTYSVYLKAGERTVVTMRAIGTTTFAACTINLTAGTISSVTGVGTITNAGNGWYRVSVTGTADSTTSTCYVNLSNAGINYTGDGSSGAFVWGAQLSNSASVDPYVYNPAAAPTSTAYYGPRFDYNPTTLAPLGLLIEEQRVNLALYSEQFDNAYWNATGGTVSANNATSPDGTLDADTFTEAAGSTDPRFPVTVTLVIGTSYTLSTYVKIKAGSAQRYLMLVFNAGFAFVSGANFDLVAGVVGATTNATGTITPVGNGWFRCTMTPSATATATSASFRVRIAAVNTSGNIAGPSAYVGDGTSGFILFGAQLEAGAFATSYIPTVASTVTRAADIAVMSGSNFSTWYNQSQGTIVVECNQVAGANSTSIAYAISDNTFNNSQYAIYTGGNAFRGANYLVGGVSQAALIGTFSVANVAVPIKDAFAYAVDNFGESLGGQTTRTDSLGIVNTASNRMYIGSSWSGTGNYTNGHIRSITYYPYRLADFQLQAITV